MGDGRTTYQHKEWKCSGDGRTSDNGDARTRIATSARLSWAHKRRRWQTKCVTFSVAWKAALRAVLTRVGRRRCTLLVKGWQSHQKPKPAQHGQLSSYPSLDAPLPACPAPVDPLDSLACDLRMTYGSVTPNFVVLQWPSPPTLKVFNLAMIHTDEVVRRMPLDEELIRLTLRGNVDDIMKMRSSIQLENIFTCNTLMSKDRKVVLIEGAPGAGKSTLAWHICQKWKAQELFHQEFKVVIYIQF